MLTCILINQMLICILKNQMLTCVLTSLPFCNHILHSDVLRWGLVNQCKMVTLQDEVSVNMNQEEDPFANYYGNIITETYIQL